MNFSRIRYTLGMYLRLSPVKRALYLKKQGIFYHMGNHCMTMFRKIPLYPKLISFGDNVRIASQVTFVTHDTIHTMLNNMIGENSFIEHIGCIEIKNNVFIGSNTTILPNVTIGPNTIIGACSLVNQSISGDGVYGGVPARKICSIEEFINKRRSLDAGLMVTKNKNELTKETIEECWNRFIEEGKRQRTI